MCPGCRKLTRAIVPEHPEREGDVICSECAGVFNLGERDRARNRARDRYLATYDVSKVADVAYPTFKSRSAYAQYMKEKYGKAPTD